MGSSRRRTFNDLFSALARLPWWLGLLLAAASFALLSYPASRALPAATQLGDLASLSLAQWAIVLARLAQFLVPALFIVGALRSFAGRGTSPPSRPAAGTDSAAKPYTQPDLSSQELELIVGALYGRQGYRVAKVREEPDGGLDFILQRGNERYLVRCKHWHSRPVDTAIVQETKAAIAADAAAGGAVLTTGEFSHAAAALAREAGVETIDAKDLERLGSD
jgi:restriction system protein